jgi:hypothetical protein
MLTLAVTFLATLYLLGPDLLVRWVIGFAAPRRTAPTNRGEELMRAVLWAAVPLSFASLWVWKRHILTRWGHWSAVDNVFICLGGNCSSTDRANLWPSLRGVAGMNWSLLWREYLIVLLGASLLAWFTVNFARLRRRVSNPKLRLIFASIITSQLADWHVWLSDMLLPEDGLELVADVLTKNGTLYEGRVGKRTIGADGSLQTISLDQPRRFQTAEHAEAKKLQPDVKRDDFWREIPGNTFIILGSDIVNVNLFYVRREVTWVPRRVLSNDVEFILKITKDVEQIENETGPANADPAGLT